MTEQPDTAAIRASLPVTDGPSAKRTRALCDALDAARAERERTVGEYIIAIDAAWTRAEAAEDRISAALEILDRRDRFGSTLPHENWVDTTSVRRALTDE